MRHSGKRQLFSPEHFGQRDQRKADQCSGIGRLDTFDQRNTQTFRLGTAGAIIGRLDAQVAFNFSIAKLAISDVGGHQPCLRPPIGGIEQADCSKKADGSAAGMPQLRKRTIVVSGLVEPDALAKGNLVGSDDKRIGKLPAHRMSLGQRQALRRFCRILLRERAFIDIWRNDLEGEFQPFEQLAPIARSGGENQC